MLITDQKLAGSIHRFGKRGVLYEVLREVNSSSALIRVLEKGEETEYPIDAILKDPTD
jgi:hypothetical protein